VQATAMSLSDFLRSIISSTDFYPLSSGAAGLLLSNWTFPSFLKPHTSAASEMQLSEPEAASPPPSCPPSLNGNLQCMHSSSDGGSGGISLFLLYTWLLDLGDKRVEDWPLMRSPWPTLTITAVYVVLCYAGAKCDVKLTGEKSLFRLKSFILTYNLFCIGLNLYIAMELLTPSLAYRFDCEPVNYSSHDVIAVKSASALWWYYLSKLIELMDSVFFIFKGNYNKLSFLHIYHHSSMFCLWWIGVKYVAGGSAVFGAFYNSIVHIIMYSYYLVAAMGPQYRKYLGWKKYLTMLQIAQFVLAIVMGINGLRTNCIFPLWMIYAMIIYMTSFLILFSNFFYQTYIKNWQRLANAASNKQ
jgi:elongation of very long chain fatty acids protein 4